MTKTELIAAVAEGTNMKKKDATVVIEKVFDTMMETLKKGEDVAISGFGKFAIVDRAARKGRNPATGAEIDIPASKKASFHASKALKEAVNA